jgi:hypothetical protein
MKLEKNIMKFYKYQPLSEEKHLDFVQNYFLQSVWMTPLKNFNDPFEGRFKFKSFSPEYVLSNTRLFNNILQEHIKIEGDGFTAKDLEERLGSDLFRQELKKTTVIRDLFSNHGVLCLTASPDNIPMWAYYADNHKGCCIVFELDFSYIKDNTGISDEDIDGFRSGILAGTDIISFNLASELDREFAFGKVGYYENLPVIECEKALCINNSYNQSEYVIRNSVGVKYKQWEHEREYRLVTNSNSENSGLLQLKGYAPFLRVTGIILGSNIDTNKEEKIRALCSENAINIYKAKCSEEDYKITINECYSEILIPSAVRSSEESKQILV